MSQKVSILACFTLVVLALGCGKEKGPAGPAQTAGPSAAPSAPAEVKPPAPPAEKPQQPVEKPKEAKAADFKLTVADLNKELRDNKSATESKYKDKLVELSGKVSGVSRGLLNNALLVLEYESSDRPGKGPDLPGQQGAACEVNDRRILGKLGRGQTVRVRGKFERFGPLSGPQFSSCEILDSGPDTLIRITGEELAKEFSADAKTAYSKYRSSTMVVTGIVAKMTKQSPFDVVEFQGDQKTPVQAMIIELNLADKCKVGEQFTCVANELVWKGGKVELKLCYSLPKE